jgi:hypothetical protein
MTAIQYSVNNVRLVAEEFNMEMSSTKTKIMAFQGKEQLKIALNIT